MDEVIHPNSRKWISKPVHLGKMVKMLRLEAEITEDMSIKIAATADSKQEKVNARIQKNKTGNKVFVVDESRTSLSIPKMSETGSNLDVEPLTSSQNNDLPSTSKAAGKNPTGTFAGLQSNEENASPEKNQGAALAARLMTSEEKLAAEAKAQTIFAMLGGIDFFNVKTNDQRKKKGKKAEDMIDGENDRILAADLKATASGVKDVSLSEGGDVSDDGYRPASVKDYFSDFSDLSEDSEDEYDDYEDFQVIGDRKFKFDMKVLSKYTEDSSDESEDEDEDEEDDINSEDGGVDTELKQSRNSYEPNEIKTVGDVDQHEGPAANKRGKFDRAEPEFAAHSNAAPMDSETKEREGNANSGLGDECAQRAQSKSREAKKIGGDEQFEPFMDRVYKIKMQRDSTFQDKNESEFIKMMNISQKDFKGLRNKMNVSLASVKGETFQERPVVEGSVMPVLAPPLPESAKSQLQSLAIFVTHGDDPTGFQWRSNNVQQQINDDILNVAFQRRMALQKNDYADPDVDKSELVDKDADFLIEISVYQAGDPDETLPDDVKSYTEPKLAYKLRLLGRQTVAELRDAMHCENDLMSVKEVDHPDLYKENEEDLAMNKYPTAALIIADKVYSDTRKPEGVDFTERINAWAARPPAKKIGPFKKGDMATTKLEDLTIQFGYPYVFTHMGNCEHILVFNKARLIEPKDEHRLSRYPIAIPSSTFKSIYCRVDNEYLAKWAVLGYDEFPEDPMMVCTECLKSYCYMDNRRKRGTFQVFPFRQLANEL